MRQEHRPKLANDLTRIVIIVLLLSASLIAVAMVLDDVDPEATSSLLARMLFGFAISALVAAVIVRLTRAPATGDRVDAGLGAPRPALASFALGFGGWALPAVAIFIVLALLGHGMETSASTAEVAGRITLLAFAVLLSEAIPEELFFRGYVTGVLDRHFAPWPVIAIQTALFTATVLLLRGYPGIADLSLFVTMGIIFGYFRLITGSVWTSVGFHTAFQTGAQLLLTHEVVNFTGPRDMEMLAIGTGPFIAGFLVISRLAKTQDTSPPRSPSPAKP